MSALAIVVGMWLMFMFGFAMCAVFCAARHDDRKRGEL